MDTDWTRTRDGAVNPRFYHHPYFQICCAIAIQIQRKYPCMSSRSKDEHTSARRRQAAEGRIRDPHTHRARLAVGGQGKVQSLQSQNYSALFIHVSRHRHGIVGHRKVKPGNIECHQPQSISRTPHVHVRCHRIITKPSRMMCSTYRTVCTELVFIVEFAVRAAYGKIYIQYP